MERRNSKTYNHVCKSVINSQNFYYSGIDLSDAKTEEGLR
jgi:hypothetical protein